MARAKKNNSQTPVLNTSDEELPTPVLSEEPGWDDTGPVSSPNGEVAPAVEEIQPTDDWANTEETAEDDWNVVAENIILNIERHSGQFNPDLAKLMIYGETGTQKTRTACTFPDALVVDVDHGMSSVDWEVDKVTIPDDDTGFQLLKETHKMLLSSNHGYETVILDTLNEMQRVIMRFTVEEYTHVRRSYGNLPGQSDYGKMLYEFMELTRSFLSLPMRVVLLAQVRPQQFETDNVGPQLIGKNTSRELERKMDVIGYIYKAEVEEGTVPEITFDSPVFVTKDRSNRLPVALQRPTYKRIAAYWQ